MKVYFNVKIHADFKSVCSQTQSDLESALKSDLETVKKTPLYKKTRWAMFATGL